MNRCCTAGTTPRSRPERAEVPELIAARAAATPDTVCVEFRGHRLTFRELDERAGRLAHWLAGQGVGPESRVVVLLPVRPTWWWPCWPCGRPAARMCRWIRSIRPPGCGPWSRTAHRCWSSTRNGWPGGSLQPVPHPAHGPRVPAGADHAAYVIYTSGSTGTPKGVVVRHGALAILLTGMRDRFAFTPDDGLLACATVAFDIAALELFLPLLAGGRVVLAGKDDITQPTALLDLVEAGPASPSCRPPPRSGRAWSPTRRPADRAQGDLHRRGPAPGARRNPVPAHRRGHQPLRPDPDTVYATAARTPRPLRHASLGRRPGRRHPDPRTGPHTAPGAARRCR